MRIRITGFISLIFSILLIMPTTIKAQGDAIPVQCGTIIDGEITTALKDIGINYSIDLAPGDIIKMQLVPVANTFASYMGISDPSGARFNYQLVDVGQTNSIEVQVPATGKYTIGIVGNSRAYIGAYTLYIGCTIRKTGEVIVPGANNQTNGQPPAVPPTQPSPPSDFKGFPGLQPVDFSGAFLTPFTLGDTFTNAQMPASGNVIIGYTFVGNAGQAFDLTYAKQSGNLSLALVVLSPTNKVVFVTGMVTADAITAHFALQESGQYTIGIFTLNLLPPVAPEATSFQIKGILT